MNFNFISEFLGTAFLVFLGESAMAANLLRGSLFRGSGATFTFIAWGLALGLPTMVLYKYSGAYFNPAVTLGFALTGSFPWNLVPGYVIAELLGGFFGACLVYLFYFDQFKATTDPGAILGVFVTGPKTVRYLDDLMAEIVGTTFLVTFSVSVPGIMTNIGGNGIFSALIIISLSYSFGGITGLAMNPARDLSPRIAHSILPIKNKVTSDWNYAWIPVVGPIIGGTIGAFLANLLINYNYPNLS